MYFEVDEIVIDLVQQEIDSYHTHLRGAKVGVVFKEKATKRDGRLILGTAERVSAKQRVAGLDFDFLITLAYDQWERLSLGQRSALVDHELCHCRYDDVDGASMRGHDVEEFQEVIDRHGLWRSDLVKVAESFQKGLTLPGLEREGGVEAVVSEKVGLIKVQNLVG